MIALGDYRFQSNENPYETFQRSHAFRWPAQERIGVYPILQFVGPGEHKVTISGTIYPLFRGGIEQFDRMKAEAAKGTPLRMVDGQGNVWGLWCITNISENYNYLFQDGLPRKIDFTMELSFYGEQYAQPGGAPSQQDSNVGTMQPDSEQFSDDRQAYINGRTQGTQGQSTSENPYQDEGQRMAYDEGRMRRQGGDLTGDYGEPPPNMTQEERDAYNRGFQEGGTFESDNQYQVTDSGTIQNTGGGGNYASVDAARSTRVEQSESYVNPYQDDGQRMAYNSGRLRQAGGDVTGDYGDPPPDMTEEERQAFERGRQDQARGNP
jgi:hypothetical protein